MNVSCIETRTDDQHLPKVVSNFLRSGSVHGGTVGASPNGFGVSNFLRSGSVHGSTVGASPNGFGGGDAALGGGDADDGEPASEGAMNTYCCP